MLSVEIPMELFAHFTVKDEPLSNAFQTRKNHRLERFFRHLTSKGEVSLRITLAVCDSVPELPAPFGGIARDI
jgi:hypothetical protein